MAMQKTRPASAAPIAAHEPRRSLAGLVASGADLTEWDADAEVLTLLMPQFGRVSATTTGRHALISERGAYGPVRLAGQSLVMPSRRIALRLTAGRGERLVMSAADPARRQPAGLHLFDAAGRLCHRIEIAAPEDLILLAALDQEFGCGAPQDIPEEDLAPATPPASIPGIHRARAGWRGMDARAHFDEILLDGGRQRAACLRHLGSELARPVPVDRLRPFLTHLATMRLPFRRSVARPGCLQSQSGAAEIMATGEGPLLMRSGPGLFALDLAAVATCWLTEWQQPEGGAAVLELYDAEGCSLALFSAGVGDEAVLWNRLTALLPDP